MKYKKKVFSKQITKEKVIEQFNNFIINEDNVKMLID